MKTVLFFAVIVQAAAIQPPDAARDTVYLVTRVRTAEARALLSARLVQMHASKLHWYTDTGVVRVELDKN
jgi:hypothetical protein